MFDDSCTLFWFFCRTNFKEPDNPNACPYSSVDDMLVNIEAQPQWIQWRSAPLKERAALARNIAKQFHPDKWDTFNPTCDVDHAGALRGGGWGRFGGKVLFAVVGKRSN